MIIDVVSANIYRLALPYPWISRRAKVASLIDSAHPDVVLFQECPEREDWIASQLTGAYQVASDHVNCPILINSERFRVVDSIGFTLWGTERKRYGSGCVVEERVTGLRMTFVSVHPSSNKERNAATDRLKQVAELMTKLADWKVNGQPVTDLPLFVGGDMNDAGPSSNPKSIASVFKKRGLADARDILTTESQFRHRAYKTSTGWAITPPKGAQIDRGYASEEFRFVAADIIFTGRAADHNFVHWTLDITPPPPVPHRLHGVDVSSHQPDWTPTEGDSFVFVKASEGTTYTNPKRAAQLAAARARNLVVGHYHYLRPGKPIEQARYFVESADVHSGDLMVCDWENTPDGHPSVADAAEFIAETKRLLPENKCGLYCNRSDWMTTTVKAGDFLWIAEYGVDKPGTASDWTFWQYADSPIDQNWSRFTSIDDLRGWAASA